MTAETRHSAPAEHACAGVPERTRKRVSRYVGRDMADVDGWLYKPDARLIAELGLLQAQRGIGGAVGEIGVHHGKLLILLCLLRQPDEPAFCVDVFDRQDLNTDLSGHGDEAMLRENLRRNLGSLDDVQIFRGASQDLGPDEITDAVGEVRLLSIDGGHEAQTVAHDMRLADSVLSPRGVAVVDDLFNPRWPGVSDGTREALRKPAVDLVPFALGINKAFFARRDHAGDYAQALRGCLPGLFLKDAQLMGYPVAIFWPTPGRARVKAQAALRAARRKLRSWLPA